MNSRPFPEPDPPADDSSHARIAAYRRMQRLATGLLAAMTALFVATTLGQARWPALGWVRAFAEASMVGACADWFAVTALFRRPFGLPIPHTGIVPRNKDRIGAALGAFIADNFLTEQVLTQQLRRIELARWGGEWARAESNAQRLASELVGALPDILSALPAGAIRTLAGAAGIAVGRATPAGDLAAGALALLWKGGRGQIIVERGAGLLRDLLERHEQVILEKVQAESYRWLPRWVDRIIARKITGGLLQLLADLRDPEHPWRLELEQTVLRWIDRFEHDADLRARLEAEKLRWLEGPELAQALDRLADEVERWLEAEVRTRADHLTSRVAAAISAAGTWLCESGDAQRVLNQWSAANIRAVIAPRRHEIGRMIATVVEGWNAESVVEKLEWQVGRDLQYIRINGTLVGGLVGLLMYAITAVLASAHG